VMHPNLSLFGLYSDDHALSMAHARVYNDYIAERFSPFFDRLVPTAPVPITIPPPLLPAALGLRARRQRNRMPGTRRPHPRP